MPKLPNSRKDAILDGEIGNNHEEALAKAKELGLGMGLSLASDEQAIV